jgi:hypothetical protein
VDKFFQTLARQQLGIMGGRISRREKKTFVKLARWFLFLLAKPEFHSQLASGYPHPCKLPHLSPLSLVHQGVMEGGG